MVVTLTFPHQKMVVTPTFPHQKMVATLTVSRTVPNAMMNGQQVVVVATQMSSLTAVPEKVSGEADI